MIQKCLDEKMMNIKGAVAMAYPMGLPDWDLLKLVLESDDALNVSTFCYTLSLSANPLHSIIYLL
jgi:hypothetical protein